MCLEEHRTSNAHSDSPVRAALPPERYGVVIRITPRVAEAICVVGNAGAPPQEQLAAIAGLQPPQLGQPRGL